MSSKKNLSEKEWQRLLAVTPEEKEKALAKVLRWVTYYMGTHGYKLAYGPFSYSAMGGYASEVIAKECYDALFAGEWHWKPKRELSSMLIEIAKSKMGHIVRDWYAQGRPQLIRSAGMNWREVMKMDSAMQWEAEANLRDMGYDFARKVLENKPRLLAYVNALYETNDYPGIAKLLKIPVKEVMKLEKEVLTILDEC